MFENERLLMHENQLSDNESDNEHDGGAGANPNNNENENKRNERQSGIGILEFSPSLAGNDVTPANFDFSNKNRMKRYSENSFHSLTGKLIDHFF